VTTQRVRPDNSIPLVIGAIYQLTPDQGGQYVTIIDITRRYVYFRGIDHHIADLKVPVWKADDILAGRMGDGSTSISLLMIIQGGYLLKTDSGRLRLHL